MNLGDKLLKLRKDNKMSQEEFAEALDVTIDDLLDKENLKRGSSSKAILLPAYETIPGKYQYVLKDDIYQILKYSYENYGKISHFK